MKTFLSIPWRPVLLLSGFILAGCSDRPKPDSSNPPVSEVPKVALKKVELKFKWPVGQRLVYKANMNYEADVNMGGLGPAMKQEFEQNQEYSISIVGKTPANETEVVLEFVSTKLDLKMGPMEMHFDSNQPRSTDDPKNPLAGYRNIIGSQVHFFLDDAGAIQRTEGEDAFLEQILKGSEGPFADMARDMYSPNFLRDLVQPRGLPSEAVKPGDSWPVQITQKLGKMGVVLADQQYQFKAMEKRRNRDCALMIFSGTVRSKPASDSEAQEGIEVLDGQTSGRTWFDPALGQRVDTTMRQEMKFKVKPEFLLGGAGAAGLEVTMNIKQKANWQLTAVEAIPR